MTCPMDLSLLEQRTASKKNKIQKSAGPCILPVEHNERLGKPQAGSGGEKPLAVFEAEHGRRSAQCETGEQPQEADKLCRATAEGNECGPRQSLDGCQVPFAQEPQDVDEAVDPEQGGQYDSQHDRIFERSRWVVKRSV